MRWLWWLLLFCEFLVLAGQGLPAPRKAPEQVNEPFYLPFDGVRFARCDLEQIIHEQPDIDPKYIRYLFGGNLPRLLRILYWRLASFATNSQNPYTPRFIYPLLVDGTDQTLIRVNLKDLGIEPKVWDRLAELGSGRFLLPDPYFQLAVVNLYDEDKLPEQYINELKGYDAWGRPQWVRKPVEKVKEIPRVQFQPAPWLADPKKEKKSGENIEYLVYNTGTQHPILRTDFYLNYSLLAPRYYEFLGLNEKSKQSDFQKVIKAVVDADVLGGIVVASNQRSGVALNNRFILYVATTNHPSGGYYWFTNDSLKSVNDRDYVQNIIDFLKKRIGKFDATEDIGTLKNRLQAYWLGDGKASQLDVAAAGIAIDKTTRLQDAQVWCPRNCITCHTKGIKDFRDVPRNLARGMIVLNVVDDDKERTNSRLLEKAFSWDPMNIVRANQQSYDQVIREVTRTSRDDPGLSSQKLAQEIENMAVRYLEDGITLDSLAQEVAMPVGPLKRALSRGIGISPRLTGLLQEQPFEIRRDQFEATDFAQTMLFLSHYREPNEAPARKE